MIVVVIVILKTFYNPYNFAKIVNPKSIKNTLKFK